MTARRGAPSPRIPEPAGVPGEHVHAAADDVCGLGRRDSSSILRWGRTVRLGAGGGSATWRAARAASSRRCWCSCSPMCRARASESRTAGLGRVFVLTDKPRAMGGVDQPLVGGGVTMSDLFETRMAIESQAAELAARVHRPPRRTVAVLSWPLRRRRTSASRTSLRRGHHPCWRRSPCRRSPVRIGRGPEIRAGLRRGWAVR